MTKNKNIHINCSIRIIIEDLTNIKSSKNDVEYRERNKYRVPILMTYSFLYNVESKMKVKHIMRER